MWLTTCAGSSILHSSPSLQEDVGSLLMHIFWACLRFLSFPLLRALNSSPCSHSAAIYGGPLKFCGPQQRGPRVAPMRSEIPRKILNLHLLPKFTFMWKKGKNYKYTFTFTDSPLLYQWECAIRYGIVSACWQTLLQHCFFGRIETHFFIHFCLAGHLRSLSPAFSQCHYHC